MSKGESDIDVEKVINHWIDTSKSDFETMITLYQSRSFGWALFLGHISTEKMLKALYVKKYEKHDPFTHNLFRLGELIGLDITDEQADWLDEITSFNLNARYDDYKKEFYKLCTPAYTKEWIENIKKIQQWIIQML